MGRQSQWLDMWMTAVVAPTQDILQQMMDKISLACKNNGMKLNMKKTNVMILKKGSEKENTKIKVDREYIEQVSYYKYLGSKIDENCSSLAEVRVRIGVARAAFWDCKEFLRRDISIDIKIRLLDYYVKSVASYGYKTWTFNKEIIQRLDALQLWCYRKILKIKYVDHVTNEKVKMLGVETEVVWRTDKKEALICWTHYVRKMWQLSPISAGRNYWGKERQGEAKKSLGWWCEELEWEWEWECWRSEEEIWNMCEMTDSGAQPSA